MPRKHHKKYLSPTHSGQKEVVIMARKINFGEITSVALNMFSEYNVGVSKEALINTKYKELLKPAKEAVEAVIKQREEAILSGKMTENEAINSFSRLEADKEVARLEAERDEKLKEVRKHIKSGRVCVTEDLYKAYTIFMKNGNFDAYCHQMQLFLTSLGLTCPDKASEKFAQLMSARCAGRKKQRGKKFAENRQRTKDKGLGEFQGLLMDCMIEYLTIDKGVLDENEDFTLTRHNFDAEAEKAEEK